MDGLGGKPLPWFDISGDEKNLMPMTPIETFYNDIDDKKVLAELVESLEPQSYGAFWSKSTYAAWRDVDSTYVVSERDQAMPVAAQRDMVANVRRVIEESGGKAKLQEISINTSHSPFVSQPEELGLIVRRSVGERI